VQAIVYSLFVVYSLPLVFILLSVFMTDFFTEQNNTVYVADAVSGTFFRLFRDTFGAIIVPLVTAYSLPERKAGQPIPNETLRLFFTLLGMFVLTVVLYALIRYHQDALALYNEVNEKEITKNVPELFFNTITSYGKELLAYIALVLGISLKK
jgi:hypothetical protein